MSAEPPPEPGGTIRLHVRPPTMGRGRDAPWVQVDGVDMPVSIGDNWLEVSAGPHVVQVAPRWEPTRIRALRVDVGPGTEVPVFYADPASRLFGGSLGTTYRQDWALRSLQICGVLILLSMLVTFIRP